MFVRGQNDFQQLLSVPSIQTVIPLLLWSHGDGGSGGCVFCYQKRSLCSPIFPFKAEDVSHCVELCYQADDRFNAHPKRSTQIPHENGGRNGWISMKKKKDR
jgi:hypothetical protein